MTSALNIIQRLLSKNGIPYETVTDSQDFASGQLTASFPDEEGGTVLLEAAVGNDGIFFTTPLRTLTEEQLETAENFASQAHKLIRTGQFHVSRKENNIRFEVHRLPDGQTPSAEELAPLLFVGPLMAQLYGPALDLVLDEGASVESALSAAEKTDGKPVMSFVLPDMPEAYKPSEPPEEDDGEDGFSDGYGEQPEESSLAEMVRDYYDNQNWKYEYDPVRNTFRMLMGSCCVDAYRVITLVHGEDWFATFTRFPIRIPKEKRTEAEEFIARANYGMILGCFELDPVGGVLQFKDTCLCGDAELDMSVLERHIDVGFRMCDRYGPALLEMLYGGVSPADAVRKAEGDILEKQEVSETESSVTPEVQTSVPETVSEENLPAAAPVRKGFFRKLLEWLAPSEDEEEFNG